MSEAHLPPSVWAKGSGVCCAIQDETKQYLLQNNFIPVVVVVVVGGGGFLIKPPKTMGNKTKLC